MSYGRYRLDIRDIGETSVGVAAVVAAADCLWVRVLWCTPVFDALPNISLCEILNPTPYDDEAGNGENNNKNNNNKTHTHKEQQETTQKKSNNRIPMNKLLFGLP